MATLVHACKHIQMNAHMHARTHTHTYTHTRTHKHMLHTYHAHTLYQPSFSMASSQERPGTSGPSVSKLFLNCILSTIKALAFLSTSCSNTSLCVTKSLCRTYKYVRTYINLTLTNKSLLV